jgi:HK97 family phage prohead protease
MFRGYAAVFDTPWNDRLTEATGYVEKVKPGVFRKALAAAQDVPLLLAHRRSDLLGTTKSGNVVLKEDGKGLLTEAKLPDNYLGEYARSMIESGDIQGMSYGIELDPKRDTMLTRSENGLYTRTIIGVKSLLDVSLTWEPAYSATSVELRTAGFVATPLQELLIGEEPQVQDAVTESPPNEETAWWGEEPPAEPSATRKPWEIYLDELEREV